MQAHIRNARVLGLGEYDMTGPNGERYRYLDLYDPLAGRAANAVVRISLDKDCTPPAAVEWGVSVDVWVELVTNEKIVRGEERDRAIGQLKLRAVDVQLAASQNGAGDPVGFEIAA
jgi:hypothetical protein